MTDVASAPAVKETKAQKSERLKLAKNPWEAWDEVREYAKGGRDSVAPEWSNLYFKWWGVYTQGDGLGVTGGTAGEGKTSEYFMMRIGMPNGLLTSHQARVIGELTRKHGRNLIDITTRQNIQLHWLTIGSLVETVDALTEINLSPKGACGDVVRNVTGCPLAGCDAHELLDASPLAIEVARLLTANPEFYNLPRKFKITISGCPIWCTYPEINDVGLTAIKRTVNGPNGEPADEIGYTLRVGGGLSTEPHIAERIPAFIPQDKAIDVITAVVRVFKEQTALRESRTHARIKYLFMKHGWTAQSMLEAIEAKLGYQLDPSPLSEDVVPADVYRDHVGITPQKQPGLSAVGASVLNGRMTADQLIKLADLAEKYADGQLRCTIGQNILIPNVPDRETAALVIELNTLGLQVDVSPFWRGAIACTGTEFCKLAIAETKGFSKWLVSELEERIPTFDQQIRLHVTGCTNSCGQSWIADIGLEGKKMKKDGVLTDAFYFCVGGAVGKYAGIARQIGYRAAAEDCPDAIVRLLNGYLGTRTPGEDLRAFFSRTDNTTLLTFLNGAPTTPVERDAPPTRAGLHVAGE